MSGGSSRTNSVQVTIIVSVLGGAPPVEISPHSPHIFGPSSWMVENSSLNSRISSIGTPQSFSIRALISETLMVSLISTSWVLPLRSWTLIRIGGGGLMACLRTILAYVPQQMKTSRRKKRM